MTIDKFNKRIKSLGAVTDYKPITAVCRMFVEQCLKNEKDIVIDDDCLILFCSKKARVGKTTYIWACEINGEYRLISEDLINWNIRHCFNDLTIHFLFK